MIYAGNLISKFFLFTFFIIFALEINFRTVPEYKKLTRSRTDCKIAGVCGGLAKYLNVDSTVVRIIFLILLLFGFSGGLIYLIIWLCAPEEGYYN